MPHSSNSTLRSVVPLLCGLSLLITFRASGAAFVWGGTSGNWSDPTKWVGGTAPTGTDPTDTLIFAGTTTYEATNNLLSVPMVLNQLVLNATSSMSFVSGSPLLFSGSAPSIIQQNVGTFQLNTALQSTRTLTLGGDGGIVQLSPGLSGQFDVIKQGASEFAFQLSPLPNVLPWTGKLTVNAGRVTSGAGALRGNPVFLTSATSLVSAASAIGELRAGTLNGNTGLVESHPVGTDDSEDLVIYAFSDGTFGGTVRVAPAGANGKDRGALIVRGTGRQTLTGAFVSPGSPPGSGALQISKDVAVGHGATLTLAGNASLGKQTQGAVILSGGTLELDNRATNDNDRVRDADSGSTGLDVQGGGTFKLIGNSAGSFEVAGRLQLGSGTNQRSGALTVAIQHNAGSTAATELTFQSISRDGSGTAFTYATVDFRATDADDAPLSLGKSGSSPRIIFGNPPPLTNGLLRNTRNLNSVVGWATVNGSAFATYGPNGIAPVAVTAPPAANSTGDATVNAEIRGNFTVSGGPATPYLLNSLRLEPDAVGQSLTIPARGVVTQGLLLAGDRDYTITGPLQASFIYVEQATLTASSNSLYGFTKSGDGTLALGSQFQPVFTINAGVVRAATQVVSYPRFRGGVLELTGGGTYTGQVSPNGPVNWQGADEFGNAITEDVGSGGFAAFGAPVATDLAIPGAVLQWEDSGFVQSGHALIFGSRTANQKVNWSDDLSLTERSPGGKYNAREIHVNDNPASFEDVAQMSGVVSGQAQNDLLKTGPGTLELTAANTYTGATLLREGRILVDGSNASIGPSFITDVYSGATFGGNGSAGPVKVRSGGAIAPGSLLTSIATFRTGALTLETGANLTLEIGGLTAGTAYDQLAVTGPVSLDGANVVLSLANGFRPQQGDVFLVLSNDGSDPITGTFAQGTNATVDDLVFEISYTANVSTGSFSGGNDIAIRVVPEPVAALSFLATLPVLLRRPRRERTGESAG